LTGPLTGKDVLRMLSEECKKARAIKTILLSFTFRLVPGKLFSKGEYRPRPLEGRIAEDWYKYLDYMDGPAV